MRPPPTWWQARLDQTVLARHNEGEAGDKCTQEVEWLSPRERYEKAGDCKTHLCDRHVEQQEVMQPDQR